VVTVNYVVWGHTTFNGGNSAQSAQLNLCLFLQMFLLHFEILCAKKVILPSFVWAHSLFAQCGVIPFANVTRLLSMI
jgi:uncharacterized MAPEG superfamily protein